MGVVVVGVDGSEGAKYALDFAITEAALRKYRLRLVCAWEIPPSILTAGMSGSSFYEEFEKQAKRACCEAATKVEEREPGLELEQVVIEGPAARALLANSEDADMLVVGRRGYGTFRDMLLGSVSRQLTVHAECPVVLVPIPSPERVNPGYGAC